MKTGRKTKLDVDDLYGHRFYVNPERQDWHQWFAWFPVKLIYWYDEYPFDQIPIKQQRMVWLKKIMRRLVIDHHAGPGREFAGSYSYYEYNTLDQILKWS